MSKMFIKKLSSIFIVILFVFSLSACIDDTDVTGGDIVEEETSNHQVLSFFENLQDNEVFPFELTEKAKTMLSENGSIFTENNKDNVEQFTDYSLEYKTLNKNIDKHGDKLVYLHQAFVISIEETELDDNTTLTELEIADENGNNFYCISLSKYENIFEEDTVNVYALPISKISYENISGGTTLAILTAGCYIEKV